MLEGLLLDHSPSEPVYLAMARPGTRKTLGAAYILCYQYHIRQSHFICSLMTDLLEEFSYFMRVKLVEYCSASPYRPLFKQLTNEFSHPLLV